MWDIPRPGLEPMSPALAGGFLTTAPPGKPSFIWFIYFGGIWRACEALPWCYTKRYSQRSVNLILICTTPSHSPLFIPFPTTPGHQILKFLRTALFLHLLKNSIGNSLAVQWLGLCALTAEGPGSIPGRGTKNPQAERRGQKKNFFFSNKNK